MNQPVPSRQSDPDRGNVTGDARGEFARLASKALRLYEGRFGAGYYRSAARSVIVQALVEMDANTESLSPGTADLVQRLELELGLRPGSLSHDHTATKKPTRDRPPHP